MDMISKQNAKQLDECTPASPTIMYKILSDNAEDCKSYDAWALVRMLRTRENHDKKLKDIITYKLERNEPFDPSKAISQVVAGNQESAMQYTYSADRFAIKMGGKLGDKYFSYEAAMHNLHGVLFPDANCAYHNFCDSSKSALYLVPSVPKFAYFICGNNTFDNCQIHLIKDFDGMAFVICEQGYNYSLQANECRYNVLFAKFIREDDLECLHPLLEAAGLKVKEADKVAFESIY